MKWTKLSASLKREKKSSTARIKNINILPNGINLEFYLSKTVDKFENVFS